MGEFVVRAATVDDAEDICTVRVDSVHSLAPGAYDEDVLRDWGRARSADRYVSAMKEGQRFFVAVEVAPDRPVIGFSSHYVNEAGHGVIVYVAGRATRRGVGSELLRAAEDIAREAGATELVISASLVAVEFWAANGFKEIGRGEFTLGTGRAMACVHMKKMI